jgi:hypothetical protein
MRGMPQAQLLSRSDVIVAGIVSEKESPVNDLEVAILESLHALGGRAKIQDIYNRILRNHVTKLQRSGEIVRVTRGTYCLTEKGCKRIGVKPSDQSKSPTSAPNSIQYQVDEFGDIVVTDLSRIRRPRPIEPTAKAPKRSHTGRPMTVCPVCKAPVSVAKLQKHMRKVHPSWRGSVANRNTQSDARSADRSMEFPEEELHQSDHEPIYGDKYVGQTRRDYDGTFGSLPLYDDYSDESGPD